MLGFSGVRRPFGGIRRTQNGHVSRSCGADRGLGRHALGPIEIGGHDMGEVSSVIVGAWPAWRATSTALGD